MKISILYHSESGNTKKIARIISEGARSAGNIEALAMSIDEIDETFLNASDAVIFGCPTYLGTFTWQMKKFLDTSRIRLSGKLGAVFVTARYIGGGGDVAELGLVGHLLVKGMLVYSGGGGEGKPFTHFGAVAIEDGDGPQRERAHIFGERIARKAIELFSGE